MSTQPYGIHRCSVCLDELVSTRIGNSTWWHAGTVGCHFGGCHLRHRSDLPSCSRESGFYRFCAWAFPDGFGQLRGDDDGCSTGQPNLADVRFSRPFGGACLPPVRCISCSRCELGILGNDPTTALGATHDNPYRHETASNPLGSGRAIPELVTKPFQKDIIAW